MNAERNRVVAWHDQVSATLGDGLRLMTVQELQHIVGNLRVMEAALKKHNPEAQIAFSADHLMWHVVVMSAMVRLGEETIRRCDAVEVNDVA